MTSQSFVAEGKTGDLAFDGSVVELRRTRSYAVTGIAKGVKRVPLTSVSALQWKPASSFTNGYVQVVFAGSIEHRPSLDWDNRAKYDENTITFTSAQQSRMNGVREAIEAAIRARLQAGSQPASAPISVAAELSHLAQLRDQGVLSAAEFEGEKAKLLAR